MARLFMVLCGLLLMLPGQAAAQAAFTCTGDIYQVQSGQLRIFDPTLSTYQNIGPVQSSYNAIGYSSADNLIYGIQSSRIIRVDANGVVTVLFSPNISSSSADMDDSNNLWIQRSGTQVTRFNVLTGAQSTFNLTGASFPSGGVDIAFVTSPLGDRIVALGSTGLTVVNPVSGAAVSYTVASYPNEGSSGATWADSTGRVFTFKNNTGNVYEIKNYLTSAPYAVLVAVGVPSGNNDGASCRSKPFPNLPPVARADGFTTPFQTPVSGNVLANNGNGVDNDPEGLALTVQTTPVTAPANGTVTLAASGAFTYTPGTGFKGTDTFTYRISDPSALTATATVTIAVTKADLTVRKTSAVYLPSASFPFAVPQNDLVYMIEITNIGDQSADNDSVFVVDSLPTTLTFFNDDVDSGGPATFAGTDPLAWVDSGSALTFLYLRDVKFSNAAAHPANFAACNYSPATGYDPQIRYICVNPKGAMQGGGGKAAIYFRARIN